jgi:zinc transporter 1
MSHSPTLDSILDKNEENKSLALETHIDTEEIHVHDKHDHKCDHHRHAHQSHDHEDNHDHHYHDGDENHDHIEQLGAEPSNRTVVKNKKKQSSSALQYTMMIIVGVANLVYSILEITFSTKLLTGSLALLGDGIHNFSDVISIIVAFTAQYAARSKSAPEYTYGLARGELIGGLINSVFLLSTAVFIIIEAIPKFFYPEPLEQSMIVLVVASVGVFINFVATVIFGCFGLGHMHSHAGGAHGHSHGADKKEEEHTPENHGHSHAGDNHGHSHAPKPVKKAKSWWRRCTANANIYALVLHFLGDTLSSIVVVFTGALNLIFPKQGWVLYVDPVCSLIIVLIIIVTGVPLVRSIVRVLLQRVPDEMNVKAIQEEILHDIEKVIEIHDFHLWQLSDSISVCTLHVMMCDEDAADFNKISIKIHQILHDHGIHNSTIQPEYVKRSTLSEMADREHDDSAPLISNLERTCRCVEICPEETCCESNQTVKK